MPTPTVVVCTHELCHGRAAVSCPEACCIFTPSPMCLSSRGSHNKKPPERKSAPSCGIASTQESRKQRILSLDIRRWFLQVNNFLLGEVSRDLLVTHFGDRSGTSNRQGTKSSGGSAGLRSGLTIDGGRSTPFIRKKGGKSPRAGIENDVQHGESWYCKQV